MFSGKTVMVTGAGGSIGSAICRFMDTQNVAKLVLFEISEYALYKVDQELSCNRIAVLGNIRDPLRLVQFMRGVDIIFHCAAYKHVPMCEDHNADESYSTNFHGTRHVIDAGISAEKIIFLSTDKAIKPSCMMGKSKLRAEQYTIMHGRTVVRLGNILESSGSVIPKFREQIASGGPVTVTHPETTRYFIEMNKAVEFITSAASKPPDTYMIDMGKPQKILDIAKEMIGDKPIEIQFTGLRPGEKLHEDITE